MQYLLGLEILDDSFLLDEFYSDELPRFSRNESILITISLKVTKRLRTLNSKAFGLLSSRLILIFYRL